MKITTFNPRIITKDAEPLVKLFEELGFEKRHNISFEDNSFSNIRMKDGNGFYLDISQTDSDIPCDVASIRMNVDDFDEAYKLLQDRGFKNMFGDQTIESSSGKAAVMMSPTGFVIQIIQHIKN